MGSWIRSNFQPQTSNFHCEKLVHDSYESAESGESTNRESRYRASDRGSYMFPICRRASARGGQIAIPLPSSEEGWVDNIGKPWVTFPTLVGRGRLAGLETPSIRHYLQVERSGGMITTIGFAVAMGISAGLATSSKTAGITVVILTICAVPTAKCIAMGFDWIDDWIDKKLK